MARPKKVIEETQEMPAVVEAAQVQKLEQPGSVFTCNVNFNNKEFKAGDKWEGEVPEAIKAFLK
jgi:hypothetical protein